jgi:hypothetical protein
VVLNEVCAARVAKAASNKDIFVNDRFSQLVEIHAAPEWLWLVEGAGHQPSMTLTDCAR